MFLQAGAQPDTGPFLSTPSIHHSLFGETTAPPPPGESWPGCPLRDQQRETDTVCSPRSQNSARLVSLGEGKQAPWVPAGCPLPC